MNDHYQCASGGVIAAGRYRSYIDGAHVVSTDGGGPAATPDQPFVLQLHESQGGPTSQGDLYNGSLHGDLISGMETDNTYGWAIRGVSGTVRVFPWDRQYPNRGANPRQSYHCGWTHGPDSPQVFHLYTERRMDALMQWIDSNVPNISATKRMMIGNSMGAWGTMTYGIRRPNKFAALYPSRPRVRYCSWGAPWVQVADWDSAQIGYESWNTPAIDPKDGGGTVWEHQHIIGYVENVTNDIPWLGVTIGRQDGYMPWQDHVDFIAALRATKRGFAYSWNDGNHSGYPSDGTITNSYPYGIFELGKGYPLFTNHSLDANPSVDLVGGINLGLTFRNVVETSSAWSCEVTHISSACTVTVEPKSKTFTAAVAPQNITIPAANSWVSVSFSV